MKKKNVKKRESRLYFKETHGKFIANLYKHIEMSVNIECCVVLSVRMDESWIESFL